MNFRISAVLALAAFSAYQRRSAGFAQNCDARPGAQHAITSTRNSYLSLILIQEEHSSEDTHMLHLPSQKSQMDHSKYRSTNTGSTCTE